MKIKFLMAPEGAPSSSAPAAAPEGSSAPPAAPPAAPAPEKKDPPAPGSGDLIGEGEKKPEEKKVEEPKKSEAKDYEVAIPEDLQKVVGDGLKGYQAKALELGVDPKAFKGLIEFHLESMRGQMKASQEAQDKQFKETTEGWKNEVAKDPEIGGAKLAETSRLATKGAMVLGGQAFVDALRSTGLANWPPMVKAMYKAGMSISEDTIGGNGNGTKPAPTAEDIERERDQKLFPSHYQK